MEMQRTLVVLMWKIQPEQATSMLTRDFTGKSMVTKTKDPYSVIIKRSLCCRCRGKKKQQARYKHRTRSFLACSLGKKSDIITHKFVRSVLK